MVEAAKILNIEAPDLYVRQSPVPNAYTLAISGKKPFVVVHTSLVELLTRKELQAVLAHELGHLKCDHGVWLTFANILTLGAYTLPGLGGLIAERLEEQLFRWLRAAEFTCDRAALLVAQDPKVVISVLMKLAGGCPSMADQLNVDAFLDQARSYDKASSSPVGWYIRNAQTRQLSHPLPVLRAREIDEWSRKNNPSSARTDICCKMDATLFLAAHCIRSKIVVC
ncbi:Peptidase family M48 family protein [Abeliophyllum distichum]|uniref:Peptidase family M48 family protein n=1 Tax=Abeliophyllum distichum TaxID=126358 RepID=A0ABD1SHM9_9LAMI